MALPSDLGVQTAGGKKRVLDEWGAQGPSPAEPAAIFSSDKSEMNIGNRVPDEKDLTKFLESPEARLIYVRSHFIPHIQKHSAEEFDHGHSLPVQDPRGE